MADTLPLSASNAELLARIELSEDVVDRAELKKRLGIGSEYLALRIFSQFDRDKDGKVPRQELVERVRALMTASPRERLRFAFAVHDDDGNGFIDRLELLGALHVGLAENRLVFGKSMVQYLADAMFWQADADGDGRISFEEFEAVLERYPGVLEQLTLGDLKWLGLGPAPALEDEPSNRRALFTSLRADAAWIIVIVAYVAGNAALFWTAAERYRDMGANVFIQLARGCGACLNLHAALILVPMMRRTLTVAGRTNFGRILIDDHVSFHRMIGDTAFYLAVGHTTAHLLNLTTLSSAKLSATVVGWAFVTGTVLLLVHATMWAFARTRIRRSGRFELFAFTHRLWPLWVLAILVHGPVAWMWMALPVLVFVVDRFDRRVVRGARVREVTAMASGVTRLTIWRPAKFKHEAADYAFIRVPDIARSEWHPFTISSAPERPECITFHIRSAGNWTNALHALAKQRKRDAPPLSVDIDGPYGTPSARIFESESVLLVAAGIGVTPFASVLSSLVERKKKGTGSRVTKVHFVWVCRDQRAFEWFAELLAEVEREAKDFITLHIYMDQGRADLASSLLRVAMDALYARCRADLVTGLVTRTTLGVPDWPALVKSVADESPDKRVSAFYCGPPGLATIVRAACNARGVVFRQEHF